MCEEGLRVDGREMEEGWKRKEGRMKGKREKWGLYGVHSRLLLRLKWDPLYFLLAYFL